MPVRRGLALFFVSWVISIGAFAQPLTTLTPLSFRYAGGPITSFAVAPTDWVVLTGSSFKSVTLISLSICGTANTPATLDVSLLERTSADSGGTSTAVTAVNMLGNNVAATSSVVVYTGNPTLGNSIGNIEVPKLNVNSAGAAGCVFLGFGGSRGAAPLTLHGVNQQFAINFGGVSLPSGLSLGWRLEVVEQ